MNGVKYLHVSFLHVIPFIWRTLVESDFEETRVSGRAENFKDYSIIIEHFQSNTYNDTIVLPTSNNANSLLIKTFTFLKKWSMFNLTGWI